MSLSKMKGTGRRKYYQNLAGKDYYVGRDSPLTWYGAGAKELGLTGEVKEDDFHQVLLGNTLDGFTTRLTGEDRVSAYDATFSVDKSLSAYWVMARDEEKRVIEKTIMEAARETIDYLEQTAGYTRRGRGGVDREKIKLIVATTMHYTARESEQALPDAQLHIHAVMGNLSKTADGKTRTLDGSLLYQEQLTAGALFRAAYAAKLEERLGLCFERDGWKVKVQGPRALSELSEQMSHRRKEIEAQLRAEGLESAKAAELAALSTRKRKRDIAVSELMPSWVEAGNKAGFTSEEALKLLHKAPRRDFEKEARAAVRSAAERMDREKATFTEREFIRFVAEEAAGRGLSVGRILDASRTYLQSERAVRLGEGPDREVYYTTRENWECEKEVRKLAKKISEKSYQQGVSPHVIRTTLQKNGHLSPEQAQAARHLLEAGGLSVLIGNPGVGKSTMLKTVEEAYRASGSGFRVIGCAISGKAANGLRQSAGIRSTTVARLVGVPELGIKGEWAEKGLLDTAKEAAAGLVEAARGRTPRRQEDWSIDSKTVIVVDEAGMVGNKTLIKILTAADRAGARVILAGDPKQLQPIGEASSPLRHLANEHGAATLTQIIRQHAIEDRKVVEALAQGQTHAALKSMARRGRVKVAQTAEEAREALICDWADAAGLSRPESSLIFARTKREVAELNQKCQEARLKAGELGPGLPLGQTHFHRFDRVLFHRSRKYFGVTNGDLGTVTAVNPVTLTLTVKLDDTGKNVHIPLREYQDLSLGYAMTTHKSQGATIDQSFVLGADRTSKELSFVQLSRHRKATTLYLTEQQAGEDLKSICRAMEKSERRKMAHELQAELQIQR